MKQLLLTFSFLMTLSFVQTARTQAEDFAEPKPGTQTVQGVELPASTSTWKDWQDIGTPRPVDSSKTEMLRYWFYLPKDYEKQAAQGGAPLFLFLHGAGERGNQPTDIGKVKVHGLPKLVEQEEFAKNWRCITVSPQCKNGYAWSPAQLMLLLDHIEKNYKVARNQIYVSGLSMGGFGTWMCLAEAPKRFAAAMPICGGAKPEWAEKYLDIPIWDFHGTKDPVVPFALSETIVNAVKEKGGTKINLTAYEGGGHDAWTQTYENPKVYEWLLSNVK